MTDMALAGTEVARLLYAAGLRGSDLIDMVAIAHRESRWEPNAYNGNASTGDRSYGLFQINMIGDLAAPRRRAFNIATDGELFDPAVNIRAAMVLRAWGQDARNDPTYHWIGYRNALVPPESRALAVKAVAEFLASLTPGEPMPPAQKYPYGYDTPPVMLTKAQILAKTRVKIMHPELMRRAWWLMDQAILDREVLGIGGSGRLDGEQDILYRSRYDVDPTDPPPCLPGHGQYVGKCWEHTSGAAAAIPGDSYHETTEPNPNPKAGDPKAWALSIDWIGDMAYLGKMASKAGMYVIGKAEPWHTQPNEVPRARRNYKYPLHALKTFALPGSTPSPVEPPPAPVPAPVPLPGLNFTPDNVVPGATGESVFLCQTILRNAASQVLVKLTGTYDEQTKAGIKNVQLMYGLVTDGLCGPKTWPYMIFVARNAPVVDPS